MRVRLKAVRHVYTAPGAGIEARPVLDIPAWELNAGDHVLLRGVSGSGKTTLFNIMAGLLRPTAGEVWIDDTALYTLAESTRDRLRARKIGYVFQNHHLLPALTALENVVMPMAFAARMPAATWKVNARRLLDRVGLADYADYRPAQLSSGMRLRVAVARALANQPPLLLADEPTSALDAENSDTVMRLLRDVCRENNAVLVIASHDPALSAQFEQIVYLRGGEMTAAPTETAIAAAS